MDIDCIIVPKKRKGSKEYRTKYYRRLDRTRERRQVQRATMKHSQPKIVPGNCDGESKCAPRSRQIDVHYPSQHSCDYKKGDDNGRVWCWFGSFGYFASSLFLFELTFKINY